VREQRAVFGEQVGLTAKVQALMQQKSFELFEFFLTFLINRTILVHIVVQVPSFEKRISRLRERRVEK